MKYLNNILFLSFLFSLTVLNAQDQRKNINGFVKQDKYALQFINIQNLATDIGTVSDTNGKFSINVKQGDTLLFSSLVYKNRKIKITETHISDNKIEVYLESGVNELEEVFLQNGRNSEFDNVSVHKNTVFDFDSNDKSQAPDIANSINPVKANGIGLISVIQALTKNLRLKKKEKKAALTRINQQKKQIPTKVKQKYGLELFTKTLHIDIDRVEIFIDYCYDNGLENFYDKSDIEIINFLVLQSKKFNKIND